jgi:hypothetical protein
MWCLMAVGLLLPPQDAPDKARQLPSRTTTSAQTGQQSEPWQTQWPAYVAELNKDLQKGIDPSDGPRFPGKRVEFEGTLLEAFDPAKPDNALDVEMEPQQITIALRLFPGVSAEKAGDKTDTVTVKKLLVKPAGSSHDAWMALQPGSRVRFRGTLGTDAVTLVTTSDIGGLVLLFINTAEPMLAK